MTAVGPEDQDSMSTGTVTFLFSSTVSGTVDIQLVSEDVKVTGHLFLMRLKCFQRTSLLFIRFHGFSVCAHEHVCYVDTMTKSDIIPFYFVAYYL